MDRKKDARLNGRGGRGGEAEVDGEKLLGRGEKPAGQLQAPVGGARAAGGMGGGRNGMGFGDFAGEAGRQPADGDMAKRQFRGAFGLAPQQSAPPAPFVVREYAHQHSRSPEAERTDFAETVFWHPVLVLPKDGAKVSFDLSDEVTRYQVLIAAHTLDGRSAPPREPSRHASR